MVIPSNLLVFFLKLLKAKLYSCQIYNNDVLIRDYIPCKDSNGIGCLFDLVEYKAYYNVGDGDFICGPDIINRTIDIGFLNNSLIILIPRQAH